MSLTTQSPRGHALRRLIFAAAALVALAVVPPQSARAQSTFKGKPTPVRSREIKGRADYPVPSSGWAKTFYYTFEAGPGKVEVAVNTLPRQSGAGVFYNVTFEADATPLPQVLGLIATAAKEERTTSKSFNLPRRSRVLMAVRLSGQFNYTITLDGAVAVVGEMGSEGTPEVAASESARTSGEYGTPEGEANVSIERQTRVNTPNAVVGEMGRRTHGVDSITEETDRRPGVVHPPSSMRSRPTPVTGDEVSGRADFPVPSSGYAKTFYYTFEAGPGEVEVTAVTRPSGNGKGVFLNVTFEVNGTPLPQVLGLIAAGAKDEREVSKTISLSKRTRVLMAVRVSGNFDYRIKLDGVVTPDM